MQESKITLEINTENWKPHPHGVKIGCHLNQNWLMKSCMMISYTSTSSQQSCSSSPLSCNNLATSPNIHTTTHIVIFKCIGVVRDSDQQRALEEAFIAREKGETVEVKIESEPINPYDSKAKRHGGGLQCRIGYVVWEVLDKVHEAIQAKQIVWTRFVWVKFYLHWTRPGPGFYAGISIVRKGEWS